MTIAMYEGGHNARPYPVDFESLEKGSEISEESIEHYAGCTYREDPDHFRQKQLHLKEAIEKHFLLERGCMVWVRTRKNGVRILFDSEVSDVAERTMHQNIKSLRKTLVRLGGVDTAQLDADSMKELERVTEVSSKVYQAVARETGKHMPRIQNITRATPPQLSA